MERFTLEENSGQNLQVPTEEGTPQGQLGEEPDEGQTFTSGSEAEHEG